LGVFCVEPGAGENRTAPQLLIFSLPRSESVHTVYTGTYLDGRRYRVSSIGMRNARVLPLPVTASAATSTKKTSLFVNF